MATRHVTWPHVPTYIPSTPQQAVPTPRETSSGGDESGEGQAPSSAVKSWSTSSEDDVSSEEGHSRRDNTDDVFVYDGVGVGDGLEDLDGIPQKTEEYRQRYQAPLRAFNAKRANRQGSLVETNSSGVSDAPSGGKKGDSSLRSSNGGGGRGGSDSANNTVGAVTSPRQSPSLQDGGEGTGSGQEGESASPSSAPFYSPSTPDSG